MWAYVPVAADPNSPLAAISSLYRVWEEYGVDSVLLLAAGDASGHNVETVRGEAERLVGSARVEVVSVDAGVERLEREESDPLARDVKDLYESHCDEGVVAVVSPAGRRLATAMALAAVDAGDCTVEVVHLHFYFGPWAGLPYPYTPRRLEPLVAMRRMGALEARGAQRGLAPSRARRLFDAHCRVPGGRELPPLRCAVAEVARILNDSPGSTYVLPGEGSTCGRLTVSINGRPRGSADLCRERDVARLAGVIASYLLSVARGSEPIQKHESLAHALAWTGLAHLEARKPGGEAGPFHELASSGIPTIVDTSLVYYGAHRYAWEGARILVPECAVVEVHSNWAEAAKKGRLETGWEAASALAYMGLRDLLGAGASIVPAPAGKCDVSIPKAEPVILNNSYIATADDGAFRYWASHPASKLATPVKVSFDAEAAASHVAQPPRDPRGLARLYYALIQSLILLGFLAHERLIRDFTLYMETPGGERKEIHLPVGALKRGLYRTYQ